MDVEGLKYILTDVWSGEIFNFEGEISFTLPPHGSRLLALSPAEGFELLDANLKISGAKRTGKSLKFRAHYQCDAELLFSAPVKAIKIDGKITNFIQKQNYICFRIPSAAEIEITGG